MIKTDDIEIYKNHCLKDFCTFKIGGIAKFIFIVKNIKILKKVVFFCKKRKIKYKIIGFGSNLLFDDNGYKGAIIVNKSSGFCFRKHCLYADSGCSLNEIISKCKTHNLSGIENLAGIPSSIGGALYNNCGANGTEIGDLVEHIDILDENLTFRQLNKNQLNFSYRDSTFKHKNYIILRVKLNLKFSTYEQINKNIILALQKKSSSQPLDLPSAGSIFKRSTIIPAKIIDDLGLKGARIGDAEISTKHAGFIVNIGNATSEDVKSLISHIEKRVFKATNTVIEREIEYVEV